MEILKIDTKTRLPLAGALAKGGALLGTSIMPGVGTAIGGFVGGTIFGIIDATSGEWLAGKIIDITCAER